MTLFVAGLPHDVDDSELEEIFEKFGKVISAKVNIDRATRKSKGFGFVVMENKEDGMEAIEMLKDISLGKKPLVVKEAEDRTQQYNPGQSQQRPMRNRIYNNNSNGENRNSQNRGFKRDF